MYEELIQRLEHAAGGPEGIKMAHDAAAAIAALQAENAELKKELIKQTALAQNGASAIDTNKRMADALSRVEAERDALLEYENEQIECEMSKSDTFCPVENPMQENCALCELKPKCPCHPCKWEWRGAQGEG